MNRTRRNPNDPVLDSGTTEVEGTIEKDERVREATRRADELKMLLDVGRAITGSLDLEQILDVSAGVLSELVDASNSFILLLDDETQELRGAGCSNPVWRDGFRSVRIPLAGNTLAAKAMRSRRPIGIEDVSTSEHANGVRTKLFQEKSLLAMPLVVRDEPIGCIVVDDVRKPRAWGAAELERIHLISHKIAVAIANARLYEDLRKSYAQLNRTQEELVKRERLAALGEMAAVVAHEVRNPLGVIFNSLGSLNRLLHPEGDAKMLLEIVGEEAERLDRIVRDLLEFARPNDPSLQPESIVPLVHDAISTATNTSGVTSIHVDLDLDPSLPPVMLDERMMRRALLNLILNALQAMPKGGSLRVRASDELREGRRWMLLEIGDDGSGIPAEFAQRIFQPFFTTKATGTGLGLAVVKRVVEAHRGRITFESGAAEGTTFSILLPMGEWKE